MNKYNKRRYFKPWTHLGGSESLKTGVVITFLPFNQLQRRRTPVRYKTLASERKSRSKLGMSHILIRPLSWSLYDLDLHFTTLTFYSSPHPRMWPSMPTVSTSHSLCVLSIAASPHNARVGRWHFRRIEQQCTSWSRHCHHRKSCSTGDASYICAIGTGCLRWFGLSDWSQ